MNGLNLRWRLGLGTRCRGGGGGAKSSLLIKLIRKRIRGRRRGKGGLHDDRKVVCRDLGCNSEMGGVVIGRDGEGSRESFKSRSWSKRKRRERERERRGESEPSWKRNQTSFISPRHATRPKNRD